MQEPHVAPWWELAGPLEGVRAYLRAQVALAHLDCWIASEDGRPFAYVETYVAGADPLAAHYAALPGDRGFHLLVGPPQLLGSGAARRLLRHLLAQLLAEPGGDARRLRARRPQRAHARASAARSAASESRRSISTAAAPR